MGHKKRNPPPRSPAGPTSASAASPADATPSPLPIDTSNHKAVAAATSPPMAPDPAELSAIKAECERALTAFRRGNHTRALRLMKEAATRHDSSALFHRVHGTVHVKACAILDDPAAKLRHLRAAIDSARRASALSPSSIDFAHFYASLLYDAAAASAAGHGYEEVVQECERALAVADPVDPAKESLQKESQQKISTPDARIAHVQQELRNLIQKANLASLSTWVKNFNTGAPGEERLRVIPMQRIPEDPMEVRLRQSPRRPNEIKKAAKTSEERRKEIEVRVAAARLLQQKSGNPARSTSENNGHIGSDSPAASSSGGQRPSDRRRTGSKKIAPSRDHMDQVQSYWNSMSTESRLNLLNANTAEIEAHYASSKDSLAQKLLSEALPFFKAKGTWKFWACLKCDEKFIDYESHIQHVVQEHMGSLSTKLQSVLPLEVNAEWIEMLLNGNWKPIDAAAAARMLKEEQLKSQSINNEAALGGSRNDEDCLSEYWISRKNSSSSPSLLPEGLKYQCTDNEFAIGAKDNYVHDHDDFSRRWPLSDNDERTKILGRIQSMFRLFIKHKSLSASHLHKVTAYATEEIRAFPSGSLLVNHALDQSPMCICFLGASQLNRILKFLQELSQSCGFGRLSEKDSLDADADDAGRGTEAHDKINLILDSSSLLLDGYSFTRKVGSRSADNLRSDESIDFLPDMDALFSWLSSGPSVGEQLSAWTHMQEEKTHQGRKIFQMLEKEFYLLQSLCERKYDHLSYEEALQSIDNFCFEELKKDQTKNFDYQSYEAILRKRQEELVERENDEMLINCRYELDVISNILKDAQALNVPRFGYDETLSASRLCDFDIEEGDDWRIHDYFQQMDTCIDVAMRRQKEQLSMELNKIDAMILRKMSGMHQLEVKLGSSSVFDYRTIILPLMKSFIWFYLENLVDEDAIEKSEAATKAFLAELALDDKKKAIKDAKHAHDNSKEKRRNKDFKKSKDAKALGHNEQFSSPKETAEQYEFPVDSDILEQGLVANSDYLNEQENLKLSEEHEVDRNFEDTLYCDGRVEDEIKEKHLVEHFDDATKTTTNYGSEDPSTVASDSNSNYLADMYGTSTMSPEGINFGEFHFPMSAIHRDHENAKPSQYQGKLTISDYQLEDDYNKMEGNIQTNKSSCVLKKGSFKENGSERTSAIAKSCTDSNMKNVDIASSQPHVKYKQGISGRIHDFSNSGQKKYRQALKPNNSMRNSNENARILLYAKEICAQTESHQNIQIDIVSAPGENEKTLGQLHSVNDDDKRFQEDLKKAVRKSLEDDDCSTSINRTGHISTGNDIRGAGLKNAVGEYNCFLNVIIQSLWHLRIFRDEFLKTSSVHRHVGDPCVICALYDIFASLSNGSKEGPMEAVSPTSLRVALSYLYPDSKFFQEGQMNDASEVLAVIFDCLHKSCTSHEGCDVASHESINMGSWDCGNNACIAHQLFGMNIEEHMFCYYCRLESRHLKYTSFFHNINANSLRTAKVMCPENTFDELLSIVETNHQIPCDLEAGGCGTSNYVNYILASRPHVFTVVLGWQKTRESSEDISATFAAIATQLDVGILYCGIDQGGKHALVSVVCYYGQHYHCFAYEHEHWVMYDDQNVKVIGSWDDVLTMCRKGHLQPQVLFFEDVN